MKHRTAPLLLATLGSAILSLACASAPPPRVDPPAPCPACPTASCPAESPPKADASPLRFDNTPPIPDTLRQRLLRYLEARSAALSDLSADGTQVLVATRLGAASQIHRVTQPGGARTQVTFEAEPVSRATFLPTQDAFVFVKDQGGDENYQLFRTAGSGETRALTPAGKRVNDFLVADDGRIVWSSNARNGADMDLWIAAPTGEPRLLVAVTGQWAPLAFSPDGRQLVAQEFVSITEQRLHLVDLATGGTRNLTANGKAAYRDARFTRDGRALFVLSDRQGDQVALMRLDLDPAATAPWRPLLPSLAWNVEELDLSHDGKSLALVVNEDGYGALHLYDADTLRERPRPTLPRGVISSLTFARKARVLAFTVNGSTTSGDVYSFDLDKRLVSRWTASEIGGLDASRFVEPELIRYRSFDGRDIPAFVYLPRGASPTAKVPVVINIHGGPESQARPSFSPLVQYLVNESRVAVLVPNVRGSDGYGKAYLALDDGMKREDSVKDIGALIDWVATRPELDASRVAVMGGSYGGYMVLASLVHFGDRLKAGIDVVGISNFVTFLENTAAYRRNLRRAEYGDESDPDMRAFLTRISPTTNAAKIKSALFVVHGANDPRVPLGEAEQIAAAVRANGLDVWKLVAMNEGHGFSKRENRDAYMSLAVLFLDKHLAPR